MVDMNSDQIFEVPDTPDQMQQSICTVSSSATRRGITRGDGNPAPSRRIKFKIKNNAIQGQSSRGNASSELPAPLDTDNFFRQAELARALSVTDDLETKLSPQKSGLPTSPVGKLRNRARINTSNGMKEVSGADVCSESSHREDKREVIDVRGTIGPSSLAPHDVPQRHVGRRKLVRNGCISPSNIVKASVKADGKQEVHSTSLHGSNPQAHVAHKGNVIDLTDNSPTVSTKRNSIIDDLISVNNMETRASQKFGTARAGRTLFPQAANQPNSSNCYKGSYSKGKEIIHDVMPTQRTGEANTLGVCPRAVVDSSSLANKDSTVLSCEQGWRRTHNHTSKLPIQLVDKTASSHVIKSGSSGLSNQGHETAAGDNSSSVSAATNTHHAWLRNGTLNITKGKRKHTSSSYHSGESSSWQTQHRGSCLASSGTTVVRNHRTPVIDIDGICSPETRSSLSGHSNGTSIDPNISTQLESDEMLARQLQEQLYNESPHVVPREEIDEIVAMSLQHEEDEHQTSRTARQLQNNTRGVRISRSRAYQRSRVRFVAGNNTVSFTSNTAPITLGLRARFPATNIQLNIDLNDYDALLALDENNHQHTGASESQINSLPQSIFQSTSIDEPCAVCLENPSIGDTIRTLPCFHKFHKECIDEWLRRKKLCPVCKCGITRT